MKSKCAFTRNSIEKAIHGNYYLVLPELDTDPSHLFFSDNVYKLAGAFKRWKTPGHENDLYCPVIHIIGRKEQFIKWLPALYYTLDEIQLFIQQSYSKDNKEVNAQFVKPEMSPRSLLNSLKESIPTTPLITKVTLINHKSEQQTRPCQKFIVKNNT